MKNPIAAGSLSLQSKSSEKLIGSNSSGLNCNWIAEAFVEKKALRKAEKLSNNKHLEVIKPPISQIFRDKNCKMLTVRNNITNIDKNLKGVVMNTATGPWDTTNCTFPIIKKRKVQKECFGEGNK